MKRFLSPPVFEDEEKTRIAGLLNVTLLIALVGTVLVGAGLLSTVPNPVTGLVAVGILILLRN
jgi:hypothetical protein